MKSLHQYYVCKDSEHIEIRCTKCKDAKFGDSKSITAQNTLVVDFYFSVKRLHRWGTRLWKRVNYRWCCL